MSKAAQAREYGGGWPGRGPVGVPWRPVFDIELAGSVDRRLRLAFTVGWGWSSVWRELDGSVDPFTDWNAITRKHAADIFKKYPRETWVRV